MHKLRSVSIIIPALNEEDGIKKTIASLPLAKIRKNGYEVEILVVDGDSSDNTINAATAMDAKVVVEKGKGYGRAYKTGFSHAKGKVIATLDADGTYPAEMFPELLEKLENDHLDMITVNRFSGLENGSMSRTHHFGNLILSTCLKFLYSVNIKDSQSGMWIIRKEMLDTIQIISDDMAFSEELKIVAFSYFRSKEVAGRYSKRIGEAKLATVGHGWKNLCYLLKYRDLKKFAVIEPALSQSVRGKLIEST